MSQDTKSITGIDNLADWRDELEERKERSERADHFFETMKFIAGPFIACTGLSAVLMAFEISRLVHHKVGVSLGFLVAAGIVAASLKVVHYAVNKSCETSGACKREYNLLEKNIAWLDKRGFSTKKRGA